MGFILVRVLVTGGAGFIGSNLVISLVKEGCDVTVVDDLSMGMMKNLKDVQGKIIFYKHDVCDHVFMHRVLDANFDYIYYLAAVASVVDSVERPYITHQVNQESVVNSLEYLRINHYFPNTQHAPA